jgi:hypothetical protein
MVEIYEIIEVESYNYPNEKVESKGFIDLWEKDGNKINNVLFPKEIFTISEGESLCDAIIKTGKYNYLFEDTEDYLTVNIKSKLTTQKRGVKYKRIFKPVYKIGLSIFRKKPIVLKNEFPINKRHLVGSIEQLSTLIELLNNIFRTVYPCTDNYNSFGFDIRNLIILACTEFESQIVGILKENEIRPKQKFYKTIDYVKLKDTLKLAEYEISFTRYPDLPHISPFTDWDKSNSTNSLDWYYNYNAIKHDRENNFNKGKLLDVINAITASYIIIIAQYGELPIINEILNDYFKIEKYPQWNENEKLIVPKYKEEWRIENYNMPNT